MAAHTVESSNLFLSCRKQCCFTHAFYRIKQVDLRVWVRFEQGRYMILVLIPFFKSDIVIWSNIHEGLFHPVGNHVIENCSAVLNHEYEVILQQEY